MKISLQFLDVLCQKLYISTAVPKFHHIRSTLQENFQSNFSSTSFVFLFISCLNNWKRSTLKRRLLDVNGKNFRKYWKNILWKSQVWQTDVVTLSNYSCMMNLNGDEKTSEKWFEHIKTCQRAFYYKWKCTQRKIELWKTIVLA